MEREKRKKENGVRVALMSPVVALYYAVSSFGVALGWLMAAGVVVSVVAEILAGGTAMVASFLLSRQAGFVVGLFLFGLLLWLLVAPTMMLVREVMTGMKWITRCYAQGSKNIRQNLRFGRKNIGRAAI